MSHTSFAYLLSPQQLRYGCMLPSVQGYYQAPVITNLRGILESLNKGTNRLSHDEIKRVVNSHLSEAKRSFSDSPLTETINELALQIFQKITLKPPLPSEPPKLLSSISETEAATITPPPMEKSATT